MSRISSRLLEEVAQATVGRARDAALRLFLSSNSMPLLLLSLRSLIECPSFSSLVLSKQISGSWRQTRRRLIFYIKRRLLPLLQPIQPQLQISSEPSRFHLAEIL